jgi:hypothetical protein
LAPKAHRPRRVLRLPHPSTLTHLVLDAVGSELKHDTNLEEGGK